MIKVLIVNSNYYKIISNDLLINAKKKLILAKYSTSKIDVPGVFEIPSVIRRNIKKFDAFVALGCVIQGQTPHFDLICSSTFNAILKLSIDFNKPIGNGIITALNMRQAINRSKKNTSKKTNKGSEAANAVVSILKNEPKKI
jgi:6,7-dimethyl-8-ribityllumazine synthase